VNWTVEQQWRKAVSEFRSRFYMGVAISNIVRFFNWEMCDGFEPTEIKSTRHRDM
jgi:hypothetical protein